MADEVRTPPYPPSPNLWPFYPLALLHDIARCLALANQGQLQFDAQRRLQSTSVSRLASGSILPPETPRPLSEAQAPGISFLLALVGHAGMVGAVGESLRLSSAGHDWLGMPAHRQIEQLRQVWWLAPAVTARWLPPSRRRRSPESYWQWLVTETIGWVVTLPVEQWSAATELEQHLLVQGAGINTAARRLPNVRQASEQQAIALGMFLLQVVLPRLGLVEIRSIDQPLRLRPTAEGLNWLRAALARSRCLDRPSSSVATELAIPTAGLRFPSAGEPSLVVEPDLTLIIPLDAPAVCTFETAHIAELVSPGPPACYRLTRDSLRQAIGWGYPVADVLFLLTSLTGGHLPRPVVDQVTAWQEEMVVVACDSGYRLHLAAPEIFMALRRRDPFRQRTQPFASGQDAWVSEAQSPELFRYLRRVGYELEGIEQIQGAGMPGERRGRVPIHLHAPLPLPQLLVVLRTFQHLRRLVPGLADPELDDLDRAVAAALAPDDLAGAERLVESHLLFLRHHFRQGGRRAEEQDNARAEGQGSGGAAEQVGGEEACPASEDLRLQAAIDAGSVVELTYADAKGKTVRRRVRPLHLETRWGRRYLLAYCELRQDERRFRLDRIVSIGG